MARGAGPEIRSSRGLAWILIFVDRSGKEIMTVGHKEPGAKPQTAATRLHTKSSPSRPGATPTALPRPQAVLQRAKADPSSLSLAEVDVLQRTIGLRAAQRMLGIPSPFAAGSPFVASIQAKLTVGPVSDKYEQEADRVAKQVVSTPTPMQRQDDSNLESSVALASRHPNLTSLSDHHKSGVGSLSGNSLDNVKVHYNPSQPAQINALTYAQGSEAHVTPGQPRNASREAWHKVQQAQGGVKPATPMAGVAVDDSRGLEGEANAIGATAIGIGGDVAQADTPTLPAVRRVAKPQQAQASAYVSRTVQKDLVQRAGIPLLKEKDPAKDDKTPLKDWGTLKAAANSDDPSAVDVHQILYTYQKLSDGWSSGMGEVAQAAANSFADARDERIKPKPKARNEGEMDTGDDSEVDFDPIPETKVTFGPVMDVSGKIEEKASEETHGDMIDSETPVDVGLSSTVLFTPGSSAPKMHGKEKMEAKAKERQKSFKGTPFSPGKKTEERSKKATKERKEKRAKENLRRRLRRGTSMKAAPLSRKGAAGSDATKATFTGYSNSVEGHLLNAYLHGPAEAPNLAPFTSSLNKTHSKQVEEPLKEMIYVQGGTFNYEVKVQDGTAGDVFFPDSITCDVSEIDHDGTKTDDGYEQHIKIDQRGNVTNTGMNNLNFEPGGELFLGLDEDAGEKENELASVWNSLRFPWSPDYGFTVKQVLEAAYKAIRAYEAKQGKPVEGSERSFALPPTRVNYTTGQVHFEDEEGDTVPKTVGKKMVASPLTMRPPGDAGAQSSDGVGPSSATENFGFEPEEPWGDHLVGGHLLNHHLHGPGNEVNLAPMTGSLNTQFEKQVETKLKTKVLSEGKVMHYQVEMLGVNDEQIGGYENLPEKLHYSYQEAVPKMGAVDLENPSNWQLTDSAITGTLFNRTGVGGAKESDDW
jgi:hypothetical protein